MSQPSILEYTDYRIYLRDFLKAKNISYRQLCLDSHIHNSYFSRVLAGKTDFSEAQMYALAEALQLREWELEYFLLLGSKSRNQVSSFQSFIDGRLNSLREKHQNLRDHLVGLEQVESILESYYEEAITARIHMALTIPRFAKVPQLLTAFLGISEQTLEKQLQKLERLELIQKQKRVWHVLRPTLHVDHRHPISLGNHKNWRVETLTHLHRGPKSPTDYHFSALFSCDHDTFLSIKAQIKEALIAIQKMVNACHSCEQVYHLGIDLY